MLKEIEKCFKEFKTKAVKEVEKLSPLEGEKKFKIAIQKTDLEIKKYIEETNFCITKKIEELKIEIEKIIELVLGEFDINNLKLSSIKEMINNTFGITVASATMLGGGVTLGIGVGTTSSALVAIEAGVAVSIGYPIFGIIAGSCEILGGGIYFLYRWLRSGKKYDKEIINSFKKNLEIEIEKSLVIIKDYIKKIIKEETERVELYYSIKKENLEEWKKNEVLFEKYYKEFESLMNDGL